MRSFHFVTFVLACAVSAAWPNAVLAQDAGNDAPEVLADTPAVPEPAGPPPGEDVMRPTAHGLRMTRKMAEGLGQIIVREGLRDNSSIGEEQTDQLAKMAGERAWDLNERYGRDGSRALERFYELMLQQAGRRENRKPMTADEAREISEKIGPGVKIIREFWEGSLEDARPVLSEQQFAEYEQTAQDILKATRRFEEKLNSWSRGEVKENETFLDAVESSDDSSDSGDKSKEYRQAERSVRWEVNGLGPNDWRRFLQRAVKLLKFDDQQQQAGEQILKHYSQQAKEIMTPEWRAKAMANRVQQQLQYRCPDQPLEPWAFRLDSEYKKMVKPVQDMGRAFRREILALARSDQREIVLEDLRKLGADHGMDDRELQVDLVLPAAGPAAAQVAEPAAAVENADQPSQ